MTITKILTNPVVQLSQSTVAGTLIIYRNELLTQSFMWIIPIVFAVIVDLIWGIPAAKFRCEKITFSNALRRTTNKLCAYTCWIILSVSISISYSNQSIAAWMMGVVLANEIVSAINNYLFPKGKKLNLRSILAVIGEKFGLKNLKNVTLEDIEKKD